MTEETLESGPEPQEPQGSPSPVVPSAPSGDKPTSAEPRLDAAVLDRLAKLEQQLEKLPDIVERGIQSTKDRRFAALEGVNPDTLAKFKKYLDQFGGDENRAIREMQVDDMLARGSQQQPRGGGDAMVTERMTRYARRILATAGIDFNDSGYKELVQRANANWNSVGEDGFYDMLENFANERSTKAVKQAGVTPAAKVAPAGAVSTSRTAAEIAADLAELQRTDPRNIEGRKALRAELAAAQK